VQKSFRYADKSGFLQVVEYVCAVKPISREEVLAVADVESSMGRNVVSQKSSARGPMQVTDGTFVYLVGRYGANNLPIIADYIDRLPPESSEAVQLRGDLQTLKVALDAMRNGHWSNAEKRKVLQLRFRPIIELLFAVDYLIEQERDLVNKGFSPETSHAYKSFRYFAGPAAGDPILAAYVDPDPTQRDQPVKPILVKVYEGIYTKKHMSPAHAREEALRSAEDVLRKNGQSSLTTVGGFVEKRVEPFMRLTGQYHQLLPPQPAYTYTQPGDNMLALK
jgi:hypothetical protein